MTVAEIVNKAQEEINKEMNDACVRRMKELIRLRDGLLESLESANKEINDFDQEKFYKQYKRNNY